LGLDEKEQRIKIAESLEWDCDPEEAREWDSRGQWCRPPAGYRHNWPYKYGDIISKNIALPDYLNDLNACHSFEKQISLDNQKVAYMNELSNFGSTYGEMWSAINAGAKQRCEAFLKVKGLWV